MKYLTYKVSDKNLQKMVQYYSISTIYDSSGTVNHD